MKVHILILFIIGAVLKFAHASKANEEFVGLLFVGACNMGVLVLVILIFCTILGRIIIFFEEGK